MNTKKKLRHLVHYYNYRRNALSQDQIGRNKNAEIL